MASLTPAGRRALDELRRYQGLDENLPWGGRSPRVLTIAYKRFTLVDGGDASMEFDDGLVEEQYRRFLYSQE